MNSNQDFGKVSAYADASYWDNPGETNDSLIEAILRRSTYGCKTGPGGKEGKK